jgi:uncharacterized protein with gpF-like domain
MNWILRLFGMQRQSVTRQQDRPSRATTLNPATRVQRPRKRGRTRAEQEADWKIYCQQMQSTMQASFQRDRQNALSVESTKYIWRSVGDADVCPACAEKNGKRFSWNSAPPGGHPGESESCETGWCRCYAEAVIPNRIR